jgi:hypothetical protein
MGISRSKHCTLILQYFEAYVSLDQMDVGLDIMKMFWSMFNNKTFKELLECNTQRVQVCKEKGK